MIALGGDELSTVLLPVVAAVAGAVLVAAVVLVSRVATSPPVTAGASGLRVADPSR